MTRTPLTMELDFDAATYDFIELENKFKKMGIKTEFVGISDDDSVITISITGKTSKAIYNMLSYYLNEYVGKGIENMNKEEERLRTRNLRSKIS